MKMQYLWVAESLANNKGGKLPALIMLFEVWLGFRAHFGFALKPYNSW